MANSKKTSFKFNLNFDYKSYLLFVRLLANYGKCVVFISFFVFGAKIDQK